MMRRWMMNQIKTMIVSHGVDDQKIYLCMGVIPVGLSVRPVHRPLQL